MNINQIQYQLVIRLNIPATADVCTYSREGVTLSDHVIRLSPAALTKLETVQEADLVTEFLPKSTATGSTMASETKHTSQPTEGNETRDSVIQVFPPLYPEQPNERQASIEQAGRGPDQPPPYPGPSTQSTVHYQSGRQIVYMHVAPPNSSVIDDYNGKLSIIFGVINMLLMTISIILNVVPFRMKDGWNLAFTMFPAPVCGFFICVGAVFSIASGVRKNRCLVFAHLVWAIIASIFAFIFLLFAGFALAWEIGEELSNTVRFAISVVWLVSSVVMFIIATWSSTLPCRVICCGPSVVTVRMLN